MKRTRVPSNSPWPFEVGPTKTREEIIHFSKRKKSEYSYAARLNKGTMDNAGLL